MKLVYPGINKVFDTSDDKVNSLIIENRQLFYGLSADIYSQIQGLDGKTVCSVNDKTVNFSKNVELINQFVPFDINRKNLITKLLARAEEYAVSGECYEKTMMQMTNLENYIIELIDSLEGNISYNKLSVGSILKAIGLEFRDDYDSLGEKIVDYMQLIREYDKDKLFIIVNIRDYIDDSEMEYMLDTVLRHQFNVLFVESSEHKLLSLERRYLVDEDLCEIS